MKRILPLTDPLFLFALFLLLGNDLFFKELFHNALTGKLSDFAGLFVFAFFWGTLFPAHKKAVIFLTGAFFAFWKSHASQDLIEILNAVPLFQVARVVDPSDLMALGVLPFVYAYDGIEHRSPRVKLSPVFPLLLSTFAFMATSYRSEVAHRERYGFAYSRDSLLEKVHHCGVRTYSPHLWERRPSDTAEAVYVHPYRNDTLSVQRYEKVYRRNADDDTLTMALRDTAFGSFSAEFLVDGRTDSSWVQLLGFQYEAPRDTAFENRVPKVFEERVVNCLRSE